MIIATIAFLTIMFGGSLELFYIDDFDGSLKVVIEDKDRKKALLAELKENKKTIDGFNKKRESVFKQYKKISKSKNTSRSELKNIFSSLELDRNTINQSMTKSRVVFVEQLTDAEWNAILAVSQQTFEEKKAKSLEKLEKDMDKGKPAFYRTREALIADVENLESRKILLASLDSLVTDMQGALDRAEVYNLKNAVFKDKNATEKDLLSTLKDMHELRTERFEDLLDYQIQLSEILSDKPWKSVNKAFLKDINLTNY